MSTDTIYNIVYIAILVVYAGFGASLLYHLLKFGFLGGFTRVMAVIFVAISVILILLATRVVFGSEDVLLEFFSRN